MVIYLFDPKNMLKHILVREVLLLTMVAICQLLQKRQLNLLLNRFWWALLFQYTPKLVETHTEW